MIETAVTMPLVEAPLLAVVGKGAASTKIYRIY